jgi:hypothetical protein
VLILNNWCVVFHDFFRNVEFFERIQDFPMVFFVLDYEFKDILQTLEREGKIVAIGYSGP